jgi:hypothetical protein
MLAVNLNQTQALTPDATGVNSISKLKLLTAAQANA